MRLPFMRGFCWAYPCAAPAYRAAAAANPLPKLFIHGTEDDLVPYEMGRRNFEAAAGEKHFLSVPGAGHALSHAADPDRVENALKTFAANILDS